MIPQAANRFCLRLLHWNFKRVGSGGPNLKNALWYVAYASTELEWTIRMNDLNLLDEKFVAWLKDKPPSE